MLKTVSEQCHVIRGKDSELSNGMGSISMFDLSEMLTHRSVSRMQLVT